MRKLISSIILLIGIMYCLNGYTQQWGLYTLYAPINNTQTYLIDTNGTTYKTWTSTSTQKTGFSVYLLPGDTLLRSVLYSNNTLTGGGMSGEVQKVLWDGTIVWDFVYSTPLYCLHHDICSMPNGNVLMICYEVKTAAEAVQAGCSNSLVIWSEKIIEVQPVGPNTGTIIWEWHLWDHLCQTHDNSKDNYVNSISDNPQLMNINYNTIKDWIHMNGIDYNSTLDQITFSSLKMNEFYIIDHSTTTAEAATHSGGNSGMGGDFLYRWGNPAAYGLTGTTNFDGVHDSHWISSDDPRYPNYLSEFNNGGGAGGKSCVDIINPPYNGYNYSYTPGQIIPPATYTYRHTSTFFSASMCTSQQLANGNMLVCISNSGNLYEIDSNGTSIWNITIVGRPANALRYDLCYIRGLFATAGASCTSVTAGTPVTLNSSATSVTETSPTYSYSWSSTPAGFTSSSQNPSVTPSTTTTYTVTITNTDLGCSSSASVTINVTVGVENYPEGNELTIYPNPTTGKINLNEEFILDNDFEVFIYNSFGEVIIHCKNMKIIDLSGNTNGVYYLTVKTGNGNSINKIVILIK
jgi:hypothetical protein